MVDMNTLYTALLNADKAGDNKSAAVLATYIKNLQAGTPQAPAPAPQGPKVLPETDTSSDLMRGLGNYPGQTESLLGSVQTAAGLAAKKMGFEDTGKSMIQKGLSKMQEGEARTVTKKSDEFTEAWEKGIGTVLTDWLPYQIGQGAANAMESLAFAGLGAGVGALTGAGVGAVPGAAAGFLSKTLVTQGIKDAAEAVLKKETAKAIAEGATKEAAKETGKEAAKTFVAEETKKVIVKTLGKDTFAAGAEEYAKSRAKQLGGYAGTAAQAVAHGIGETSQQALQQTADENGVMNPEQVDLNRLGPAAIVHSVADFINERIGLGALKIGEEASKHLITDIAKRIAVTGLKETGGEEIQSMAERYGANMSLTDADALKDYVNTAAASFGMAVGPGAVGGARTHIEHTLFKPTSTEGTTIEPGEEAKNKAAAGATPLTQQQLDDIMSGKTPIVDKTKTPKLSSADIAADFVARYPAGEEGKMTKKEARGLYFILKNLGIENPKAEKGQYRIKAMEALRDHFNKKNAADELTDIPDLNGTANVDETTEAKQTTPQGQQTSTAPITWDTMQPGQQVTLYRGENKENVAGGQWWTTDPAKAAKFGTVTNVTLPAEVIAQHAAKGHGGPNEFVFPTEGKRPSDLVQTPPVTPPPPPSTPPKPMTSAVQKTYDQYLAAYNANPNDKTALGMVNSLEKRHGMPLTMAPQGRVLSAKKTAQQELQELQDIRPSETTTYEYDPDLSPELNQVLANTIAQNEEEEQAAHKKTLTEMSDEADVGKYEVSEEDKALYLEQKAEHDAKAREANAKRNAALPALEKAYQVASNVLREATKRANTAIAALDAYKKANKITEDVEAADYATTKRLKKTDSELLKLTDAVDKAITEESNASDKQTEAYEAIHKLGPKVNDMPRWHDLSAADKDVYFGNIKYGSKPEHRKAAQTLVEHRSKLNGMENAEQRVANAYTETRALLGKAYRTKFPEWRYLSDHAKEIFREGLTNLSGLQLDRSFGNLAKYLNEQNTAISERQKVLAGVQIQDRLNRVAEQTKKDTKEYENATKGWHAKIDPETGEIERDPYTNERIPARFGSGEERVSKTTLDDYAKLKSYIADGDLSGALGHISQMKSVSPFNRIIAKAVRSMLQGMKSPPLLVLVNKLSNNDLGQYDPSHVSEGKIGKISIRSAQPEILLHEAIHAVTVQVLHTYFEGNRNSLTAAQRAGAEQLLKIMVLTKKVLGDSFPNAYEDIYEFVSYGLTNSEFKNELAKMELPGVGKLAYLTEVTAEASMPQNLRDMPGQEGAEARAQFTEQFNEKKKQVIDVDNISAKDKSAWSKFKLSIANLIVGGFRAVKEKVSKVTEGVPTVEEDIGAEETQQENQLVAIPLKDLLFQGNLGKAENQNFLMEIAAAFEDIMAPQTGAIALEDLSAKKNQQQQPAKPAGEPRTEASYALPATVVPDTFTQHLRKLLTTQTGHLTLERLFQHKRAVLRKLSEQLAKSKLLVYTGDRINDIYGQITTSVADAKNYFNRYIDQDLESLNSAVGAFARAAGLDTKKALEKLHPYLEALHEPERRLVKYILTVPLVKAADAQRQRIVQILDTQVLDEAGAKYLRDQLDSLIFAKDAQGNFITDPATGKRTITNNVEKLGNVEDIDNAQYNATGLTSDESEKYRNDPVIKAHQAEVDKIVAAMKKLGDATTELNKIGHYWSHFVSNRVAFYGWEHYVPLKGAPKHNEIDEMLDFDSRKMGRELQDSSGAFGGRIGVSKNPILQMATDATRSAIRAGQRNLTLAIKNSLEKGKLNPDGQGLIKGGVVDTISFADRTNEDLIKKYKGENYIFHYRDDGAIDILKVEDKHLRNAIRQTFKSSSPLIDKANQITGLIAQGHTRYNYNFGPMNFVRDALTNSFVIGAEMSSAKAAQYIKAMATIVVNGGMYKAMQVAILHQRGHAADIARLNQMAKGDTFIQHMVELVNQGGMVTHLSGLSLKSQFQDLKKEIGKSNIMTKKEQFDKFVDTWTNMFEIASRTSAYMVAKQNFADENKAAGMNEKQANDEAGRRAVAFSKNLANFEQVGEWGKAMGALYMFFRPSATGAARSLQAITPAFTSLKSAVDALPPSIKNNEKALAEFQKNYALQQRNARIMMGSLIALGFFAHTMSKMMAPDDDLGRNAVDTDDMDRWTRYARFHIPNSISKSLGMGEDVVLQLPWGMGLGAFAAAGAQLSAMYDGKTSITKGLANIFGSIALDSFVPIPISKMPPTEEPLQFLLDSIAPSMVRPALEIALNKNGLGQAIHNDQSRRMGDAYTGGDNIPQIYKDAARGIANSTTGDLDWNPNTIYFLTNTFMDGPARVLETLYGINDLAKGEKAFNPKTDIPLMGSFFGSKVNIDAQQFSSVEQKIKRIEGIMKEFATDPEREAQYMEKHPLHAVVVEHYNKELASLNALRKEANEYRLNKYLSPKERQELLKLNTMQANVMKNQMIEVFKAYDVKP
jgi:Large polyvalent protein associated domain 38